MKVQASVVGHRIHVKGVGADIRDLHEQIPGANFSKTARAWTLPLSMDSCRALRETFKELLEIKPSLWQWAGDARKHERSQARLGRKHSGVALRVIPDLYPAVAEAMASRPYQATAARFISEGRAVLVADTPGLGKTLEAIAGCLESASQAAGPYLICAPATSLSVVWEREILMRTDDAVPWVVEGSAAQRAASLAEALDTGFDLSSTWIIINIEMLRTKSMWVCPSCGAEYVASDRPRSAVVSCGHDVKKVKTRHDHKYPQLFEREWGGIIMDECQRSLIRTTGTPTQTRAGAKLLRVRSDGVKVALSGTPMRGKAPRLWGTLNWLRPDIYTSYWSWVERFFKVNTYGRAREIGNLRPERMGDLNKSLNAIMLRRTKAEVSPELPPKQYMGSPLNPRDPDSPAAVWLSMTPAQAKAYAQMKKMGTAVVDSGRLGAVGLLAEQTRMKMFATCYMKMDGMRALPTLPSNKFDWLVQFLTERSIIDGDDIPTGKVVIVSQFTSILEMIGHELEHKYGVPTLAITGKVTGSRRAEAERAFNSDRSRFYVLLLNTKAGGVSITLDAADDMVFLDETHDPDDQEQAEDRINNRRPEEKVATRRYWYLKSLGTIDEAIAATNLSLDKQGKQLLDGRRGLEYVRVIQEAVFGEKGKP
jgi:SNF2 family DNA or RNA helicase